MILLPRRIFLCTLLAGTAILNAQHAIPADFEAKADRLCNEYLSDHKFMGSVLVAQRGKPIFRKAYGFADAEWDVPNVPDGKFRLGSITKQFTATMILQLVEQGKLSVDDPISKYYTDAPAAWAKVKIHNLLNHTSGIPSYTDDPKFGTTGSKLALTPTQIIQLTQDKPLQFEPGSNYRYDNTGYILLGYVIEKLTGETYAEHLQKTILDPLGMKDTGFDVSATILKKRTSGYAMEGSKMINASYIDMTLPFAAGSLYSTVDDLSTWDQALYTNKMLSAESKKKMFTSGLRNYGYGFSISSRFERPVIEHGGGINGFNTVISRYIDDHVVVIVLSNLNSASIGKLGASLAELLFKESPGEPKTSR